MTSTLDGSDPAELVFQELARLMRVQRERSEGICLFLGAGCSLSSSTDNLSTTAVISRYLAERTPEIDYTSRSQDENYKEFVNSWLGLGLRDRNEILTRYIPSDLEPSQGYTHLAQLAAAGYIKAIITTNFDNLIDRALQRCGVDYLFHCGDRPAVNPTGKAPTLTLVKVHGGLNQCDLAFSPDDLEQLPRGLAKLVQRLSSMPTLVVGFSGQDRGIMRALSTSRAHTAFWASPNQPSRSDRSRSDRIFSWLDKRVPKGANFLSGSSYGVFDELMTQLSRRLFTGGAPPVGTSPFR
jgi:hypothetical protein